MAGNLAMDLRGQYSLGPAQDHNTQIFSTQDDPFFHERNQLLPFLMGQMASASARAGSMPQTPSWGGWLSRVGGQAQLGPQASTAPIWDEQQIQSRVNAARALTDAQRDTNINKTNQSLGQKGFATTNSPLAMQMAEQQRGMAMMANAANENNLRWQAAQGNAEQVMKGQIANQQAWANYMNNDAERRRIAAGAYTSAQNNAQQNYLAAQQLPLSFADAIMKLMQVGGPQNRTIGQSQRDETYTALRKIGLG